MLEQIRPFLNEYIVCRGSGMIINIIMLLGIAAVSVAVYYITEGILRLFGKVISRSSTTWDDDLLNSSMMRAIAQLSPALAVNWLIPGLFGDNADSVQWLSSLTSLYILWAIVRIFVIFIGSVYQVARSHHNCPWRIRRSADAHFPGHDSRARGFDTAHCQ